MTKPKKNVVADKRILLSEVDEPIDQAAVDWAFPLVNPGIAPFGSRVLVQIRTPGVRSKGGLIFTSEVQEVELWNTQTAMVRAIGPLAFKNRGTLEAWPEGNWVKEGMFVRIPKYNQDKWWVEFRRDKDTKIVDKALFMLINDLDLLGEKTGNPLALKAYIA